MKSLQPFKSHLFRSNDVLVQDFNQLPIAAAVTKKLRALVADDKILYLTNNRGHNWIPISVATHFNRLILGTLFSTAVSQPLKAPNQASTLNYPLPPPRPPPQHPRQPPTTYNLQPALQLAFVSMLQPTFRASSCLESVCFCLPPKVSPMWVTTFISTTVEPHGTHISVGSNEDTHAHGGVSAHHVSRPAA